MNVKARIRKILGPRLSIAIRNSMVNVRAGLGLLPRVIDPTASLP